MQFFAVQQEENYRLSQYSWIRKRLVSVQGHRRDSKYVPHTTPLYGNFLFKAAKVLHFCFLSVSL